MVAELDCQLTEEQDAAEILAWRTDRALRDAPDLFKHVRSLAAPQEVRDLDGMSGVPAAASSSSERGETLPQWSAPLLITAVDDADESYVRLVEWVQFWSETLRIDPPATHAVAWTNLKQGLQGFRAGTTPDGAGMLVRLQTMWLLVHADEFAGHESVEAYRADVTEFLSALRARYPMRDRHRGIAMRECPACGEVSVSVDWADEDSDAPSSARVVCGGCGWSAPSSDVAYWLRRVA